MSDYSQVLMNVRGVENGRHLCSNAWELVAVPSKCPSCDNWPSKATVGGLSS